MPDSGQHLYDHNRLFYTNVMGSVLSADDVPGCTRGFLYADAGSIASGFRQVVDRETQFLMVSFYRFLKSMNPQEAPQRAKSVTREK